MSDIPSGALDAGESKAVSLLARVILPRPGETLDIRKLYIEESETNARRAHAPTRTTLEIAAESEVSFATYFNAFPASYWRRWSTLESVVLRIELTGSARVDVYRSKATGARITVGGAPISSGRADPPLRPMSAVPPLSNSRSALTVRGRRLDLVRHHHQYQGHSCTALAGMRRCTRRAGPTSPSASRRSTARPTASTRWRADVGSVGGQGDWRGDRIRPGHQESRRPPRLCGSSRRAWVAGCRSTTSPTSAAPAATAG